MSALERGSVDSLYAAAASECLLGCLRRPCGLNSPEFWAVHKEFMARYAVTYEGVDESAPADPAQRTADEASRALGGSPGATPATSPC